LLSHAGTNCSSNYPASTCRATERVIRKEANVVLHANKAEDINQVLKLQKVYHFKLIIMGGAEAHVIVDKLVAQGVSVVLTPNMLQPTQSWSTMATLPDYGLQILLEKGVNVGIAYGNVHKARGLRWITGRLMEMLQLPFELALSLITTRIVEIFDLTTSTKLNGARTKNANKGIGRIQVGTRANFVLFDGNPLTFEGAPRLVALGKMYDIDLEQD
jgi:imidazolonepropionase-like amidohydrolase